MDLLYFNIIISVETQTPPAGYLFLCPPTHFKTGTNSFRWPAFPAYWSCDPSGVERLSTEEADNLGFPSISLNTTIWGRSWDASVYAGLRQFHQGKGFDPDSQDVARHLDQPLYQPFSVLDAPFSHGESECSDDEDSEVFIDEYFNELTEEECDSEEEDSDVPTDEAFVEPDYDSEEETSEVPAEEDVDESARVLVEQTVGDAEVWVHGLVLEV
ncbi:hypothetical protein B0H13DRAFT_891181 [Mycena leptocephala]|nr:hypothetical protein B0H13DRAFT_891181 [Mycena leptocephala]